MKKQEFLRALWNKLSELPKEDIETSLDYYAEMIEDRMESGLSEEEAVAAVGSVEDAAKQNMAERPKKEADAADKKSSTTGNWAEAQVNSDDSSYSAGPAYSGGPAPADREPVYSSYNDDYYRAPVSEKKSHSAFFWLLIVLGFPVWFPLLMVGLSLLLVAFILVWVFSFVFFIVAGSFAVSGVAGLFLLIRHVFAGHIAVGLVYAGFGFVLFGLAIFMFMSAGSVTKLAAKACAAIVRGVGRLFGRRRVA